MRDTSGEHRLLTVTSLFSIVVISIHWSEDIVRGMSGGGLENLIGIAILVVWLHGTLVMREQRAGLIIVLLGALATAAMPVLHLRGHGVGGDFARSRGALFFIWTLYALGVSGTFGVILSARALRRMRAKQRSHVTAGGTPA